MQNTMEWLIMFVAGWFGSKVTALAYKAFDIFLFVTRRPQVRLYVEKACYLAFLQAAVAAKKDGKLDDLKKLQRVQQFSSRWKERLDRRSRKLGVPTDAEVAPQS
jgi:hypothetical protein